MCKAAKIRHMKQSHLTLRLELPQRRKGEIATQRSSHLKTMASSRVPEIKNNRMVEGVTEVVAVGAGVIIATRTKRERGNRKDTRDIPKQRRVSTLDMRHLGTIA